MSATISHDEAMRLRGAAIRKYFDLPEAGVDPAAAEQQSKSNMNHDRDRRIVRIGASTEKAVADFGRLSDAQIVAAILRTLPDVDRIERGDAILFDRHAQSARESARISRRSAQARAPRFRGRRA